MEVQIYTDGSSRGNPGPGGFGAILISGRHRKEISGGYKLTTNNRMELLALITALEMLKQPNLNVSVFTDSRYVCDAVEKKWLYGWLKKGFSKVKNADLWIRFYKVYKQHNVKINWIKGHAGHPENERCDHLATSAALGSNLLTDDGYENSNTTDMFN